MSKFRRSLFGYNVNDIDKKLAELDDQLGKAQEKVESLELQNKKYAEQMISVSGALVEAKERAQIIVERAENNAATIVREAQEAAASLKEKTRQQVEDAFLLLDKQLRDFEGLKSMKSDVVQMIDSYIEKVQQVNLEHYEQSIEQLLLNERYQSEQTKTAIAEILADEHEEPAESAEAVEEVVESSTVAEELVQEEVSELHSEEVEPAEVQQEEEDDDDIPVVYFMEED